MGIKRDAVIVNSCITNNGFACAYITPILQLTHLELFGEFFILPLNLLADLKDLAELALSRLLVAALLVIVAPHFYVLSRVSHQTL
jgi:hypothetical protein